MKSNSHSCKAGRGSKRKRNCFEIKNTSDRVLAPQHPTFVSCHRSRVQCNSMFLQSDMPDQSFALNHPFSRSLITSLSNSPLKTSASHDFRFRKPSFLICGLRTRDLTRSWKSTRLTDHGPGIPSHDCLGQGRPVNRDADPAILGKLNSFSNRAENGFWQPGPLNAILVAPGRGGEAFLWLFTGDWACWGAEGFWGKARFRVFKWERWYPADSGGNFCSHVLNLACMKIRTIHLELSNDKSEKSDLELRVSASESSPTQVKSMKTGRNLPELTVPNRTYYDQCWRESVRIDYPESRGAILDLDRIHELI
ncbi:uncharacterized protein BDR25DRAFT_352788 [Lindgomyces ingoldianus]|uniref:Uncharacterized protein n=1 Tax=Lindgomyces ingoldianus TaxID=673940 RepID=A0ACB6R2A6_9PLEO|nr:uncharacterized protein BDR25DRAFT_352788 [Lindgomyces ingoldianus]KAF2473383.1 hypothetical protein BDR25DRAFT_352788 [Lindgomyces ingoldianus]